MKKMMALTCALAAVAATAELPTIEGADAKASGFTAVTLDAGVKTMIAVPYQACGGAAAIAIKDLVSTQNLATATSSAGADTAARLYVLQATSVSPVYNVYYLDRENGWSVAEAGTPAPTSTLTAGDAFFLENPSAVTAYTKGGLVTTAQNTSCAQGYNLVSAISTEAYTLGDLTFTTPTGAAKMKNADRIILQDTTTYWYKAGTGWYSQGASVALSSVTIPAGTGFWYYNVSETPVVITPASGN